VKVTIVEALPTIIQAQGKTLSSALTASFKKKGIDILVNTVVEKIETKENGLDIHLKGSEKIECEMSLLAVGRRIHSEGLGLEKIGLKVGEKGEIKINDQMQTDIPNIYAIGDVMARYKYLNGFNVLHPMGWDSFGLPAENASKINNLHPKDWTKQNIAKMKSQLKMLGLSIDWSLEISTCDKEYYKVAPTCVWTPDIFKFPEVSFTSVMMVSLSTDFNEEPRSKTS